jgi:hypothetical protein
MVGYLNVPIEGFKEFYTYRYAFDTDVEVIIGEDSYVFSKLEDLKLWMFKSKVYRPFIERFVDLIWNYRLIHFDLENQYLTIPKSQAHPLRPSLFPQETFTVEMQPLDGYNNSGLLF